VSAAAQRLSAVVATCGDEVRATGVDDELANLRTQLRRRTRTDDPVDADLFALTGLAARAARSCDDAPIFRALELMGARHGASP
jgi:hypothetical protein